MTVGTFNISDKVAAYLAGQSYEFKSVVVKFPRELGVILTEHDGGTRIDFAGDPSVSWAGFQLATLKAVVVSGDEAKLELNGAPDVTVRLK